MATAPDKKRSLDLLRRLFSLVKPVMAKHNFTIGSLHEFYPKDPCLLGMNMNKGFKIFIRLRYGHDPTQYLDEESLLETMLHELTHNLYGPHDKTFFDFLNKISDELNTFRFIGKWDGEGFLSEGKKLGGGGGNRFGGNVMDDKNTRLKALEERLKLQKLGLGTTNGRGGRTLNEGGDVNQVLARGLSGKNAGGKSEADRRAEAISRRMGLLPKSNLSPSNPSQHAQTCPSSLKNQKEAEKELKEIERLHGIVVITINDDDDQDEQNEEEMLESMGKIEEMEERIKKEEKEDSQKEILEDRDEDEEFRDRDEENEIGKGKEKEKKKKEIEVIYLDSSDEEMNQKPQRPLISKTTSKSKPSSSSTSEKKTRVQQKKQDSATESDSDVIVIDSKESNEKAGKQDSDSEDSVTEDEDSPSTKTSSKNVKGDKKLPSSTSLFDKSNLKSKTKSSTSNTSKRPALPLNPKSSKPAIQPTRSNPNPSSNKSKTSRLLNPPKNPRISNPNLNSAKAMKELEKLRKETTAEKIWKLKEEAAKREKEDKERAFNKALGFGGNSMNGSNHDNRSNGNLGYNNRASSSTSSSNHSTTNQSSTNHSSSSNFSRGDYLSDSAFDQNLPTSLGVGSTSTRGKIMSRRGGSQWPCQFCTLLNNSEQVICSACETNRPGVGVGDLVMAGVSGVNSNGGLNLNGGEGFGDQSSSKGKGKGKARERDVDLIGNGWQCSHCGNIMKDEAASFWSCSSCGQIKGSS